MNSLRKIVHRARSVQIVQPARRLKNRIQFIEPLEQRRLLIGSPWSNLLSPLNVNNDTAGAISPIDALLIINDINSRRFGDSGKLPVPSGDKSPPPYVDVSCDQFLSPRDALLVINRLNGADTPVGMDYTTNDGKAGSYSSLGCAPAIHEGTRFLTTLTTRLSIPASAAAVTFRIDGLELDSSSSGAMKDAFEVALLDVQGRSLVKTLGAGKDTFLNASEGTTMLGTSDVVIVGNRVTLSLAGIPEGSDADLVFRLVNNDGDMQSAVSIRSVEYASTFVAGPDISLPVTSALVRPGESIDLSRYADVSSIFQIDYARTTFNTDTGSVYADISVRNAGQYEVDVPLFVAVKNISDPRVRVRGELGSTTDGVPYFEYSSLVKSRPMPAGATTNSTEISFYNPERVQFTYDLVFYGQLNRSPSITSEPNTEAIVDRVYRYSVTAIDPDADPISFSLVTASTGMTIDAASGVITWTPTSGDNGTTRITVRADDSRGGFAEQRYVLSVIVAPPNRPPVITSTPVVTAQVRQTSQRTTKLSFDDQGFSGTSGAFAGDIYRDQGAVFARDGGMFYAHDKVGGHLASSLPYSISFGPSFGDINPSTVRANFVVPGTGIPMLVSSVSLTAGDRSGESERITVRAFSANGNLLASDAFETGNQPNDPNVPGHQLPSSKLLTVTADGIAYVLLESTHAVAFDDFEFKYRVSQSPYQYDVVATDPDGDALTYSFSNAPVTMQIDPLHGNIQWDPAITDIGDHNITVSVNDGRGGIATQQYVVQVNADPLNHPPVIVSEPLAGAAPESVFKYNVDAIDADDDVLRYSLTSGPDSMSIDSASGLVSWNIPADVPTFEFAYSFGGGGRDEGRDVATDSQGNIYLTGLVSSTVDLDPGPGVANVVPGGTQSAFVAKYSPDGTLLWLRALGGAGSSTSNAIIIDRNDNIYLAGNFRGTVDFDPGSNQFPLTSSTNGASFVWKLDTSGNFSWVRATEGNPDEVSGEGLAVDNDGNVVLLTNFYGTIDADPGANVLPFSGVNRVSSDGVGYKTDILLVKLSSEGTLQWARHFGDSRGFIESQRRSSIATNPQGDVLLTGRFQFTMDFDPGPAVQLRSSVNSSEDIFALKLTSAGDLAWVRTFNGTAADRGFGIDTDELGNVAITGIFAGTLDLDPGAGVAQVTASNPSAANLGYNAPLILLDTDGQFRRGSKVEGFAYGVTFDDVGNLYTIGSFGGIIDFDPGQEEFKLDGGETRWYTSKYTNSGDFIWAHASGGYAITVDCHGYVVSTGYYSGRFDFDPTGGVREFTSTGGSLDAFVNKTTMAPTCADVTVRVDDDRGGFDTQSFTIEVGINRPPKIVSPPVTDAFVGQPYRYDVDAVDPDNDTLTYSLTTKTSGMVIDTLSGRIAWDTPSAQPQFEFTVVGALQTGRRAAAYDTAVDSVGNVYSVGFFDGTVDFDPSPADFSLVASNEDAYVTKYDANGNFLWAARFGGIGNGGNTAIAIDRDDNVLLTGNQRGQWDFDPGSGEVFLSASTYTVKLSKSGSFLWARGIGSSTNATGITSDSSGNVYITGDFQNTLDPSPLPGDEINSRGDIDGYVVKYDADGNFLWVRSFGGADFDDPRDIEFDSNSHIYLTGGFRGTSDFDPGPSVSNLTATQFQQDFVLKLTLDGNFVWARAIGGVNSYPAGDQDIVADLSGNVYIAGTFTDSNDFDPGSGVLELTSNGGYDTFVAKLAPDGTLGWVRQSGGSGDDESYGIDVDGEFNVYSVGIFQSTVDFDPGSSEFPLVSVGSTSLFARKLNPRGDFVWAIAATGANSEFGDNSKIAVDDFGGVITEGSFVGSVDFDPGSPQFVPLTGTARGGFFIQKLVQPTHVAVRVDDGHGGFDTQSFELDLHSSEPGEIRGTVFNDADGNLSSLAVGQPTVLATGSPLIDAVAVTISPDDSTLYVTDFSANGVFKIPAAGGTPVLIASGPNLVNTRDIAISPDGMSLYVIGGQNGIVRVPTTGGQPSLIAAGLFGTGIAVSPDGSTLYFLDSERTGILRMPATGGLMLTIGSGFPEGNDVAISDDGQQLYITTKSGVFSLPTSGGVPVLLAAGSLFVEPVGIALSKDQKTLLIVDGRWRQSQQTTLVTLPVEGGIPKIAFVGSPFAGAAYSAFSHGGTDLFVADTGFLDRYSQGLPIIPANTPAKILKLPIREEGLQNWTVYVDDNHNGKRDPSERFTLTDQSGGYSFPNLAAGNYEVTLEPQNGWFTTTPATAKFDLHVNSGQLLSGIDFGVQRSSEPPVNRQPAFVSTAPTTLNSGELLRYNAIASDPDNDPLTFDLVVNPSGMAVQANTGIVVWIPSADQVGSHDVTLRVSDGRGGVALQSFVITVAMPNSTPVITSRPKGPAVVGLPYEYRATAQDADGDPIVFSLGEHPAGMTIDANSGVVSWTPAANQVGSPHVDVIASDNRGASTTQSFDLPTVATAPNRTPNITSIPRGSIRLGSQFLYAVIADDPDGDPLVYSLPLSPTGMAIDPKTGLVTWTPTANQMGAHDVQVKVDDGRGASVTQSFTVTVVNQSNNRPPNITSTPPAVAVVGRAFTYDVVAVDPDGDPLAYSLDESPNGMSVNATAGSIRWTPTADQLGPRNVVVRVIDGQGGLATQSFTLLVRAVNTPPNVTSTPPTFASIGNAYSYAVRATDIDGDALTFAAITLPTGMTIDSQSGLIRWTPAANQLGSHEVAFRVDDGQGGTATQIYSLVVTAAAANNPPVITSNPNFVATVDSLYQYNVTATDADGDTLTYQLQNPPAGMLINSTTGVVTWTPTTVQLGTHTITVAAIDGQAGGTQMFTLRVATVNRAPTITSQPPPGVVAGLIYRYDVKASDPDGDPLTYTLDSAPPGMTIDNLGRITWQTTKANVGTHRIAVSVEDDRGLVITQTFDIAIIADGKTPLVNLIVKPGNRVAINSTLTFIVTATDNVGVKSIGLTINGNAVPLDAAGRVSFIATPVGLYDIVASATDDAGNTGLASTQVLVFDNSDQDPPTVNITSPLDNAIVSAPIDVVGTASDANLAFYTLSVAPFGSDTFTELVRKTTSVTAGVLGKFDPTGLANDSYILRLEATDTGGNVSFVDTVVQVAGDLKIGNFTLSFTDMTVPVSGIPITVSRTYDTLQSNQQDDFGFGWRLEFRDTNLRTSVPSSGAEEYGSFTPYYDGARVYVTAPGGRREGFTFRPSAIVVHSLGVSLTLGVYNPAFVPDDGVTSQLSVQNFPLLRSLSDGLFYGANGLAYNPTDELNFGGRFYLTTKDGIAYEIDATTGDLVTLSDANRNVLTFTEAAIESNRGPRITFQRDPQGRITSVTDLSGNRVQYQYDAKGDLVSVTDRESNVTRFIYSEPRRPHFLTEIIDPLGRTGVRTEYDAQGRLIKLIDAAGNPVQLNHDPDNSIETVTDALGNSTSFEYDARGNVVTEVDAAGGITRRTYDSANNMLTERDPLGNVTTFTYDGDGNLLTETNPLGNVTRNTYTTTTPGFFDRIRGARPVSLLTTTTDPLGNTTTNTYSGTNLVSTRDAAGNVTRFAYDAAGNQTSITDAAGNVTSFEYDTRGNLTRQVDALGNATLFTYDANGNQLSQSATQTICGIGFLPVCPAGGPPIVKRTLVTTTTYDTQGRPISVTDAEGKTTQTEYDKLGNQIATVDALGRRTTFTYDDRGQLIGNTFPDGTTTSTSYDALGRRISSTDRAGGVTKFVYDALGRLTTTIYPDTTPASDTDNPRTRTEYDLAGRVTAQIDELGHRTGFVYDAAGRQTVVRNALGQETSTSYDIAGRTIAATDALGNKTQFVYDTLGRQVRTQFADGTTTSTAYDALGRSVAQTDQAGRVTMYEYDSLGRLTAVVDALGQRTQYTYDEAGNLLSQRDANGNVTRYEYDGLGRRTAHVLPLGQRSTTVYDAVGNVTRTTDFNGDAIIFGYDVVNRLTSKSFPDSTSVQFTYNVSGQRETYIDARGTTRWAYDVRDRLVSRTDPDGRIISYTYDAAGNRTSLTVPSGTTNYTFDELNRTSTVTDPDGGVTRYTYDAGSRLIRTDLPNGTFETRQYDVVNHLLFLENRNPTGVISSYRYTLDATGNRTAVVEDTGRRVDYFYDDLYRLTRESIQDSSAGNRNITYTYDPVGNRLLRTDSVEGNTSYAYDSNDRLLTETLSGKVTNYTYDKNGNTLSKISAVDRVFYDWDYENRLIAADTNGDGTNDVTYRYDGEGIRVSSTVGSEETRFLIDSVQPYQQVIEEYTAGGVIKVSYVHGLDLISQNRAGEGKTFYHIDGLGSTRALSSALGIVTDRYVYEAFGRTIGQVGSTGNVYLFAGEQRDGAIGLDYLRARWMSPNAARFVSRDPLRASMKNLTDFNRYGYGSNNPISYSDPTGLYSLAEISASLAIRGLITPVGYVKIVSQAVRIVEAARAVQRYVAIANNAYRLAFLLASFFDFGNKGITSSSDIKLTFSDDFAMTIRSSTGNGKGSVELKPTGRLTQSFSFQSTAGFSYDFHNKKLTTNGGISFKIDILRDSVGVGRSKLDIEKLYFSYSQESSNSGLGFGLLPNTDDKLQVATIFEFLQVFEIGFGVEWNLGRDVIPFVQLRGTKIRY